jgi:hypothetical protein
MWSYGGLYLEMYGAICGGAKLKEKLPKKKKVDFSSCLK